MFCQRRVIGRCSMQSSAQCDHLLVHLQRNFSVWSFSMLLVLRALYSWTVTKEKSMEEDFHHMLRRSSEVPWWQPFSEKFAFCLQGKNPCCWITWMGGHPVSSDSAVSLICFFLVSPQLWWLALPDPVRVSSSAVGYLPWEVTTKENLRHKADTRTVFWAMVQV